MGPIRALAQEPVQNSKDAARGRTHVEYRLHERPSPDGAVIYLLTVTDYNTTGLRGQIRSLEDIQAQKGALGEGENWAAFEGMGYTKKEGDDALGSRGQGKAAYLYHSDLHMMLYDTLLDDGEYRLGVRRASPVDSVLSSPYLAGAARRVVSTQYTTEDGTEIQLGLEPLTQTGTRIIVPHLSREAVDAFRSGELYQWLQRCWWRAVQIGLTITVVDENGGSQSVAVPAWWESQPWMDRTQGTRLREHIRVVDGLTIKRIVLLYDESLSEADVEGASSQFQGVQLLRGQQWIETLGTETLDCVPRDKRSGFRGFAEFDREAERELHRAENTQHERFDRRSSGVKAVIATIESQVREFAEEQGWVVQESTRPPSGAERDAAMQFLRFFAPHVHKTVNSLHRATDSPQLRMDLGDTTEEWQCDLHVELPTPQSTRVNWGDYIRNVGATVRLQPDTISEYVSVSLELVHVDDRASRTAVASQRIELRNGEGIARFGNYQIITGTPTAGKIQCAQRGKWRIIAQVRFGATQVARASQIIFVNEDPPEPGSRAYALSTSVENHTTQQHRINSGDTIGVQISVTNRTVDTKTLHVTASLGDLLLADMVPTQAPGTPAGGSPVRVPGVQTRIVINPSAAVALPLQSINLSPGSHALRADLYLGEEVVAHASRTLDVEVDPVRPQEWPPFRIEQISGEEPYPRWQFDKRSPDDWVLYYSPDYPLYRALGVSGSRSREQLSGVSAFVVDVCAEGIIEWAMEPLDQRDSSRLEELLSSNPTSVDPDRWEEYCDKMRELANLRSNREQVDKYGQLVRDCAARLLSLFEERR